MFPGICPYYFVNYFTVQRASACASTGLASSRTLVKATTASGRHVRSFERGTMSTLLTAMWFPKRLSWDRHADHGAVFTYIYLICSMCRKTLSTAEGRKWSRCCYLLLLWRNLTRLVLTCKLRYIVKITMKKFFQTLAMTIDPFPLKGRCQFTCWTLITFGQLSNN